MDYYQRLANRLDEFPTGAPNTEHLQQILKILFTEEEAKIASQLPLQPMREKLSKLADQMGIEPERLKPILEALGDKGLVFSHPKDGEPAYALLPLVPGIFELQFMKAGYDPKSKALARLFNDYYYSGWGKASFSFKTSYTRTIPIQQAVAPGQTIEPYQNVRDIIENSKWMALTNCFCRHEHELIGDACNKPKDVCMVFGPFVDFAVARGFARRASKEEMLDQLALAEEAGLVHITDNVREKISFICNCCGCCCGFLSAINKLNLPSVVANSGFVAQIDEEKCDNCGVCAKRCQVKALWLEPDPQNPKKKVLKRNLNRCLGCGVCVSKCKQKAITMVKRPPDQIIFPKHNFMELGLELMKERQERR